jgi:selenocysteine-specific elongation factor
LRPGQSGAARLVLREPALLWPGDHFIIRMFSPVVTIGGGVVLDTGGMRYRKADDPVGRLKILAEAPAAERVALLVRESPFGMGLEQLLARTGLLQQELETIARGSNFIFLRQPQPWLMARAWFDDARARLTDAVREFHRTHPLLPGMAKQELRGREMRKAPPFVFDALLAEAKDLAAEGETVRLSTHRLVLKQDEEQARTAIERAFEQAGLAVPAVMEVLTKSGVEAARARSLLQILIREKRLVRVSEELVFHHSAITQLRALLAARKGTRFNVGTFKDWTGISRKYAIPLLEYLDRERVTRRDGDERLVL